MRDENLRVDGESIDGDVLLVDRFTVRQADTHSDATPARVVPVGTLVGMLVGISEKGVPTCRRAVMCAKSMARQFQQASSRIHDRLVTERNSQVHGCARATTQSSALSVEDNSKPPSNARRTRVRRAVKYSTNCDECHACS